MRALYKKIAKEKNHFNLPDFEEVYYNRPHLLSWIDYFKNNDLEIYSFLDKSVIELLRLQFDFFKKFSKIICSTISLNGNKFKFETAIEIIEKFTKLFEIQKRKIENLKSNYNIRSIIEKLKKQTFIKTHTPATVKNNESKKFVFEEAIKSDDISFSFNNLNDLIKNNSGLNFDKMKNSSLKENVSQIDKIRKKYKSFGLKKKKDFFEEEKTKNEENNLDIPEEPYSEEGLDKGSIEKIGRIFYKAINLNENREVNHIKSEEFTIENCAEFSPARKLTKNESPGFTPRKSFRRDIKLKINEDDMNLKKRSSRLYSNNDNNENEFNLSNSHNMNNLT